MRCCSARPTSSRATTTSTSPGGEGLHMIFNFWVNQHLFLALATGDARPLEKSLRETANIPARGQWAHFLRNHDELALGRLSADDRERVMGRFAPDPTMQ